MATHYRDTFQATAVNFGGREGHSELVNGNFGVNIVKPGSKKEGTNPEELFALGYSACFNSALDIVKEREKIDNDSLVRVTVHLLSRPIADLHLQVEIEVALDGLTLNEAQHLGEKAHKVCPYSKAVSGNIDVLVKGAHYDDLKTV